MSETKKNQNKKVPPLRPLALNPPYATEIGLSNFKALVEQHRQSSVTAAGTIEGELIERSVALQFSLICGGGASAAAPFERLEKLTVDVHAACNGFVRWKRKKQRRTAIVVGKNFAGPRQFLYQTARCHLLAFTHFRVKKMSAAEGELLFPKLTREVVERAQTEIEWLQAVKGNPTWKKVFNAYLNYRLSLIKSQNSTGKPPVKTDISELTELGLGALYNFEPPLTLEVRRGKLNYASLSDVQFNAFLPLKQKIKKKKIQIAADDAAEEIADYYAGNSTNISGEVSDAESDTNVSLMPRRLAVEEVSRFLDYIVDNDTTYSQAIRLAEQLINEKLFDEDAVEDIRLMMLWLIDRLRRKKKKGNRVSSFYTYSQRLLYMIEDFDGARFADLTLEDIILFLSQYTTANAARG